MTSHLIGPFGVEPDDARQVLEEMVADEEMIRDACDMLVARVENGYPISAIETPEMIAREMIEQSDPWPNEPFPRCVRAVCAALAVIETTDEPH